MLDVFSMKPSLNFPSYSAPARSTGVLSRHQATSIYCQSQRADRCGAVCSKNAYLKNIQLQKQRLRPLNSWVLKERHSELHATSTSGSTAAAKSPVIDRLEGDKKKQWEASLEQVTSVGFEREDAIKHLERAFGWRSQAFWRGLKKEEVPDPDQIAQTLKYLTSELGLSNADIQTAIGKFPEGLASGVEDRLQPNMDVLQKQFYMPKKNLAAAVKRQPKALGFSYDCEGSCEGECHRCWVRF